MMATGGEEGLSDWKRKERTVRIVLKCTTVLQYLILFRTL